MAESLHVHVWFRPILLKSSISAGDKKLQPSRRTRSTDRGFSTIPPSSEIREMASASVFDGIVIGAGHTSLEFGPGSHGFVQTVCVASPLLARHCGKLLGETPLAFSLGIVARPARSPGSSPVWRPLEVLFGACRLGLRRYIGQRHSHSRLHRHLCPAERGLGGDFGP